MANKYHTHAMMWLMANSNKTIFTIFIQIPAISDSKMSSIASNIHFSFNSRISRAVRTKRKALKSFTTSPSPELSSATKSMIAKVQSKGNTVASTMNQVFK